MVQSYYLSFQLSFDVLKWRREEQVVLGIGLECVYEQGTTRG